MDMIEGEVRSVNMVHEMYNDSLFFVEQLNNSKEFGEIQRNSRMAIICMASSFETFLNVHIRHKLKDNVTAINNGKEILDFIENGHQPNKNMPNELKKVRSKVQLIKDLYGVNLDLTKTNEFTDFETQVIFMRNELVHYTFANFNNIYQQSIVKNAQNAGDLLRKLIILFEKEMRIDPISFYKETVYQVIK